MRRLLGRLYLELWRRWRRWSIPAGDPSHAPPALLKAPSHRPRILVVTPFSVHPMIHGGAVRIGNLVRRMSNTSEVFLMVLSGGTDDPEQRRAYQPWCTRVFIHHLPPDEAPEPDPWHLRPPSAAPFAARHVSDRVAALVDAYDIDIVQLEFAELGGLVGRCGAARTVLDELDLGFQTQARQRKVGIGRRFDALDRVGADAVDGLRQEHFEILACERADQVHLMSHHDRDLLAPRLHRTDHLRVIPNGVDLASFCPPDGAERQGVLFLGSFPHLPNLDAFEFLMAEIWPEIRDREPDATLTVAGARPPESVTDWDGRDGVRVVGEVDDVIPLYQQHRVLVVPLRAGSGTRLKVLEAMACGLPVVSTSLGAEGIALGRPPEILLADEAGSMASRVAELLGDSDERIDELGRRGRSLVEARYGWDAIAQSLRRAHLELMPRSSDLCPECSTDPVLDNQPTADVSVVVACLQGSAPDPSLIDRVLAQKTDRSIELLWVAYDPDPAASENWRGKGGRLITVAEPSSGRGAMLNAGARAARGRVLVFLSEWAAPCDDEWLEMLAAPFDHDDAPAAVQGAITANSTNSMAPTPIDVSRIAIRWSQRHGGIALSSLNAAVRKDVWQRVPFPPDEVLADQRWQRLAHVNRLAVVPRPNAVVRLVRADSLRSLLRADLAEGCAWRRLDARVTVVDLAKDLVRPRWVLGATGAASSAPRGGVRLVDRLRSIALFVGNRLPLVWSPPVPTRQRTLVSPAKPALD